MKKTSQNFLSLIKSIFIDISFLYKNFIHWNFSKILILIGSFIIGILLSLPFFLFGGILALIDPIEWMNLLSSNSNIYLSIGNYAAIHPFYVLAEMFLFVLGIVLLFLGISYHIVLESNLYLHYFKKEKLPYKKNHYFDAGKIYTYLGILIWIIGYLLLPVLTICVIFLLLFLCFKFLFLPEVILSVILFIACVICAVWFLYLSYRLTFSYLIFMDENNYSPEKKSKFYIAKSFKLTAGKVFFKFLGVFIVFAVILAPFNAVNINIDEDITDIKNYFGYKSGQIEILYEDDQDHYEYLQEIFSHKSDEEVISDLETLYTKQIIYGIFFFLLITGVFTMVLTSFYKRALKIQWSKVKDDSKKETKKSKEKKKASKDKKTTKKSEKNKSSKKKKTK